MDHPWISHGSPMSSYCSHGFTMDVPWGQTSGPCRSPMGLPCYSRGSPMGLLWACHGSPVGLHGSSMGMWRVPHGSMSLPWVSYVSAMGPPWACHGPPWVLLVFLAYAGFIVLTHLSSIGLPWVGHASPVGVQTKAKTCASPGANIIGNPLRRQANVDMCP